MKRTLWDMFGLSRAAWLTIPRVLLHAMPDEWQDRMAVLLQEYEAAFPNQPDFGTSVRLTRNGKLVPIPEWVANYRHPNHAAIDYPTRPESFRPRITGWPF